MGAIEAEILGFANGTITASGRLADARDRVAFVNITELDAGIGGVPVSLLSPLNAELRGDDVTLKDLFVRVGSGRLSASGQWNTRLDGNFRAQFARRLPGCGPPRQGLRRAGQRRRQPAPMQFDLQSNGSRLGTVGTLAIKNGTFGWVGAPAAVQDLNINAALERRAAHHRAHHRQRRHRRRDRQLLRQGRGQGARADARAPIDGAIVLDSAKFTFSGIPVEQQRPSRFEFSKGNVAMADVSWLVAREPADVRRHGRDLPRRIRRSTCR